MPTSSVADPKAQATYDAMMGAIHPDLVSGKIVASQKRRIGETPEQYKQRMQEYAAAFIVMDEAVANLECEVECQEICAKAEMEADRQEASSHEDKQKIDSIEQQFTDHQ